MIIQGTRGTAFTAFLKSLLERSYTFQPFTQSFLTSKNCTTYERIFVHKSISKYYEYYEFIGDATLNKSVVYYLANKFPYLQHDEGVFVLTRLKHNLISTKTFSMMAKQLGFTEFITREGDLDRYIDSTLEDIFEAWFGLTETLIDQCTGKGIGYRVCFEIISSLLDSFPISLKYSDVIDAKTRLKELFDCFTELGSIIYQTTSSKTEHHTKVFRKIKEEMIFLAEDVDTNKVESHKKAAEKALIVLASKGYQRPLPKIFQYLETIKEDSMSPYHTYSDSLDKQM